MCIKPLLESKRCLAAQVLELRVFHGGHQRPYPAGGLGAKLKLIGAAPSKPKFWQVKDGESGDGSFRVRGRDLTVPGPQA